MIRKVTDMTDMNESECREVVVLTVSLFVVIATSAKSFLSSDPNNEFSLMMARYYGFNIVSLIFYFIYIRIHLLVHGRPLVKVLNFLLVLNLALTGLSLLFLVMFSYVPFGMLGLFQLFFNGVISFNVFFALFFGVVPVVILLALFYDFFMKFSKELKAVSVALSHVFSELVDSYNLLNKK